MGDWIGPQQDVSQAGGVSDKAAKEQERVVAETDATGFGSDLGDWTGTNRSVTGPFFFPLIACSYIPQNQRVSTIILTYHQQLPDFK